MGFATGKVLIHGYNRLKLDFIDAELLMERCGMDLSSDYDTSISGVRNIKLEKWGGIRKGETSRPVVFYFYLPRDVSGSLYITYQAKVVGENLIVRAIVEGKVAGKRVTGQMRMVCKKSGTMFRAGRNL